MREGSITIRPPVDLKEIERLHRVVRKFGELHELPSRTVYAVNLALDEIVTNVFLYGFDGPSNQEIEARLTARDGEVETIGFTRIMKIVSTLDEALRVLRGDATPA